MTVYRSLPGLLIAIIAVGFGRAGTPRIPCNTDECRSLYAEIVSSGCQRLRGIYELRWTNKFVNWTLANYNVDNRGHLAHKNATPAVNRTRLIPMQSYQPFYVTDRYISIADIHGDFDLLCTILVYANVMDLEGKWIADSHTHIIQTGDIVDRGTFSTLSYALLFDLQDQTCDMACSQLGAPPISNSTCLQTNVILLYGNHELMHLLHDDHRQVEASLRFPTTKRLTGIEKGLRATTISLNSAIERFLDLPENFVLPRPVRLYDEGGIDVSGIGKYASVNSSSEFPSLRELVTEAAPAFKSNSFIYDVWDAQSNFLGTELIRRYNLMHKLGDQALYVHAGIESDVINYYKTFGADKLKSANTTNGNQIVERVNVDAYQALMDPASSRSRDERLSRLFGNNSPVWTRKVAHEPEAKSEVCAEFENLIRELDVRATVVGHSVVRKPAEFRCGGLQIMMDTGMSSGMMNADPAWLDIAVDPKNSSVATWHVRYISKATPKHRIIKRESILSSADRVAEKGYEL